MYLTLPHLEPSGSICCSPTAAPTPNQGSRNKNGLWLGIGNDDEGRPLYRDISDDVFGAAHFTRVIKGRDIDGDGNVDLLVGNTYQTQSRLYLGRGGGRFEERTDLLPQIPASMRIRTNAEGKVVVLARRAGRGPGRAVGFGVRHRCRWQRELHRGDG